MISSFKEALYFGAIACGFALTACSQSNSIDGSDTQAAKPLQLEALIHTDSGAMAADIRYTSYGVPHIKSESYEGLGFGLAYAFAGDNICLMAEQYLTLRGERSKYFGTETFYHDMFAEALGEKVYNVDSDFYHKLVYSNVAAYQKAGASPKLQKIATGWVEGYNKYIKDNAGKMPDACNNAGWVMPITENDVYRRFLQSYLLGGYGTFMKSMADATVPVNEAKKTGARDTHQKTRYADLSLDEQSEHLGRAFKHRQYGSNAVAFGADLTPAGRPMMFGNPHFPWAGSERLYQMHLTIPGEYDIAGSALYGIPFPQIGYNKDIAWSVTWSTDIRFLIRELKLNSENSQQYYVDGQLQDMDVVSINVEVKDKDGATHTQTRLAYQTIYGPLLAGQYFKGSKTKAFAITDFNIPNNRAIETFFQLGQANSVADIDNTQNKLTGSPYSNVTGVDAAGQVYFANKSVAANVTDEQIERCLHGKRAQMYKDRFAVVVLDGSDSSCDPQNDPKAPQKGIIAAVNKPSTIRSDYTVQTNDSHWIVNADPASFNAGHGYVVGVENTERSERLRYAISFINDRKTNADGLGGNVMTPDHMKTIFYKAGLKHAELMRDDLVADCEANPTVKGVDLVEACMILKNWDLSESSDSVGTHIFREFYRNISTPTGVLKPGTWRNEFDPKNPLTTPNGLNVSKKTRKALAKAVKDITAAGIPLDARLGDIQFVTRNGEKISFSGGQGFHHIVMNFVPQQGYTDPVLTGDSYIMAVSIGADGPSGYEVNAYSQSTNLDSVHSYDQTKLYGNKNWAQIRFSDAEIEADPNYRIIHIEK